MTDEERLARIESALRAASGRAWSLVRGDDGAPLIRIEHRDGREETWHVSRDDGSPVPGDTAFIASCRHDLERLLTHARGGNTLTGRQLDEIGQRWANASPAPWTVYLESDGGLGGCSFVQVGPLHGDDADLYVWRDAEARSHLIPDPDFKLVGIARAEIPGLLADLRDASPARQ